MTFEEELRNARARQADADDVRQQQESAEAQRRQRLISESQAQLQDVRISLAALADVDIRSAKIPQLENVLWTVGAYKGQAEVKRWGRVVTPMSPPSWVLSWSVFGPRWMTCYLPQSDPRLCYFTLDQERWTLAGLAQAGEISWASRGESSSQGRLEAGSIVIPRYFSELIGVAARTVAANTLT